MTDRRRSKGPLPGAEGLAHAGAAGPRAMALRSGLPYGAVMATAGAATVARDIGLPALVTPLLALAILQALWIPFVGAWRHREEFRSGWRAWLVTGPAREHSGIHTVPLGVAVITGGVAALGPIQIAGACLVLTWLLTLVFAARFLRSLARHGLGLRAMDGAWFLVPAASLGAAIATNAVGARLGSAAALALAAVALAGALVGWIGYWLLVAVAAARLLRFGLRGVPQAPWWIAMGCAGLAAAALGDIVQHAGSGWALQPLLVAAAVVTTLVAIALCIPVLGYSAKFLLRDCHFEDRAVWPPTFSSAVFTLGCLVTADVAHCPALRALGFTAGYATLLFWTATTAWNVGCAFLAHGRKRRR